jgi:hypothetical protein
MKRRSLVILIACTITAILSFAAYWHTSHPNLPHIRLHDGSEFRVLQITYTKDPSDDIPHNLHAPRLQWWAFRHLPESLQRRIPSPANGIGYQGSSAPALSIWWACFEEKSHQPELGPSGDVIVTLDSGQEINLGWPSPADGPPMADPNDPPGYRQIFLTPVPTESRKLTFDVPVLDDIVRFTIDNPAYHPPAATSSATPIPTN